MDKYLERYSIKIPQLVTVYFCNKTNFLLITGKLGSKLLKMETKIILSSLDNYIFVTEEPLLSNSRIKKQKVKAIRNTTIAHIKKSLLEVSKQSYKKLKLYGTGFKVSLRNLSNIQLLQLNVGYSHSIFF